MPQNYTPEFKAPKRTGRVRERKSFLKKAAAFFAKEID